METLEVGKCPVCEALVEVVSPRVGLEVECPECGEALKLVSVKPIKFHYALDLDDEPLPEEEHRLPPSSP